jgi:hypothetical protein
MYGKPLWVLDWLGRYQACLERWKPLQSAAIEYNIACLRTAARDSGYSSVVRMLYQARHDLRMSLAAPSSVVAGKGDVFDYFDAVRKIIEEARTDIFFIDPWIDASFVATYLPHVANGVTIRLLTSGNKLSTLIPAVSKFQLQENRDVEVRKTDDLHDRYLFIDRRDCYQSGASFKDGALKSPTALTPVVDALSAIFGIYEKSWEGAEPIVTLQQPKL